MFPWSIFAISSHEVSVAQALLVTLTSAAIVALLLQRVRIAALPVYLITGALIGPHAIGLVPSVANLHEISHLAIILLLFGIGLDLDLAALRHGLARMVAVGLGSCLVTMLVGWPIAGAFGLRQPAALAMAMAMALSSTAVVLRILAQRREIQQTSGRLSLSILVIQDLLVLAILAALPALAAWAAARGEIASRTVAVNPPGVSGVFLLHAALRLCGMAALVILGRWALPRLVRAAVRAPARDVLLILGVALALGAAYLSQALGFSLEIGAFLAGFLLSGTAFRHQLSGQVGPLRDLFIAVFFTTLGMELDAALLVRHAGVILLGVAVLLSLKTTLIGAASWAAGATAATAITVGLALSQAGEFSLILINSAQQSGLLERTSAAIGMSIVVVSIVVTPSMIVLGRSVAGRVPSLPLAPWLRRAMPASQSVATAATPQCNVIIGGFGPVGQRIAEQLARAGCAPTVVELNPETVETQGVSGGRFLYGDVANREIQLAAGIEHAQALVLTIPDEEATLRAITTARRLAPRIFVAARAHNVSRSPELLAAGADLVISDEGVAAEALAREVVARLGTRDTTRG